MAANWWRFGHKHMVVLIFVSFTVKPQVAATETATTAAAETATELCEKKDISDIQFVKVQEDTIDETDLEPFLNIASLDLRELYLDAAVRVMAFTIQQVPDTLTFNVGYREDVNSSVKLLLGGDGSPLPVESGTDLTPQLEDKKVASVVFFLPKEGIQGTDGVTLDVDEIVDILADFLIVKLCDLNSKTHL
ncbi:hypothetical protein HOLleu_35016 [Holothuria leucospilota]|uniref:Uncharacterized protein n=1 Tax=Holothuria leucospilota TaxID=206669 RepID=A0A9Q1BEM1_HOLLE|nr:hypothetical protein HOLleu_35016 [Holothuria leucospilota]